MGVREQLAGLLGKTGGSAAILAARARLRLPVLSILTYHHVADPGPDYRFDPDVADVTPAQVRRQMELVKQHFSAIGVQELLGALDGKKLPPNPCMITFDDGYRSNLDVALPILRDLDLRAVFFIATSFTGERKLYWWDRIAYVVGASTRPRLELTYPRPMTVELGDRARARAALVGVIKDEAGLDLARYLTEVTDAAGVAWSRDVERRLADELIMTWDEVRRLRDAGMDIASHSRGHRVLQTLDAAGLRDELDGSRADLARELGRAPEVIAYPVGRSIVAYPQVRAALSAAGYRCGLTNAAGVIPMWKKLDALDIGRVAVDRGLSDDMFLGQLALPQLSYTRDEAGGGGASALRARAQQAVRRTWMKYALRGVRQNDAHGRLDLAYSVPDPWHMDSDQERHRFAETNRIVGDKIGARFDTLLEIGCGEGHQSEVLQRLCDHLTGIDVSPKAIERARKRLPDAAFASGDLYAQPWAGERGRFELITACEVIYYMSDRRRFLETIDTLGKNCLVTYFAPAARKVEAECMAMPGAQKTSFSFGETEWIAVWWKGAAARAS